MNSVEIAGLNYNINTTTLDLRGVYMSSLSENIGKLKNLETLDLDGIPLSSLPESIGKLKNLKILYLSNNNLTSLPESIGKLTNLEMLDLSWNRNFTSLPESIGKLTNLKELYLSGLVKLTNLETLGKLTNLKILRLNENELTSLPESIGKLRNLEFLDLSNNKLTSIPESFKNLKSSIKIMYKNKKYNRESFLTFFKIPIGPKRVSRNTEILNSSFLKTNKISNIPKNKRVYLNINAKNTGELRRLYNKNGINGYMKGRTTGRLHGGTFNMNNVTKLTNRNTVNKNVYLRNIDVRLQNSPLNNFTDTLNKIKSNLPSNVSRNDVNNIARSMKPKLLKKIFNKLKNTPSNNRVRLLNSLKNRGLMNNSDISSILKKLNMSLQ